MDKSGRGNSDLNSGTPFSNEKAINTELIIVDTSVADYRHLLKGIGNDTEVIVLDPERDGMVQVAEALAGRDGIRALHILSHGSTGRLELGSASVDLAALDRYEGELEAMSRALAPGGDILLYGCDVAKGAGGHAFISALGRATGADVAASEDKTGPDRLGGDWILENQTGEIEASIPFSDRALSQFSHTLAAFTERFEWTSYSNCERLAHTNKSGTPTFKDFTAGGTSFRISTTPDGDGVDIKYGRGGSPVNGSIKFDSVKTDTNTIERFTITRADGKDWTLSTLDYTCSISNKNVKVEAFIDGNRVQSNWLGGWNQTLNFRNKAVDTLIFSGKNFDFFEIDNLVGDSTLLPPTQLRSSHGGVLEGGIDTISSWELSYKDQLSPDHRIIYTLNWMTGNGRLFLDKNNNNTPEALEYLYNGYRVSQQDINDGKLKYEHSGGENTSDSFEFSVTNERGLSTTGQRFDLTIVPVNDAPILTATQTNPEFMEAGPVTLFTTARVGMWEAGQNITGLTLTVANVTDPTEGLAMDGSFIPLTDGATGTTGSHGLNYTVSLAGGTATVTLAGTLSPTETQTLINTMGYDNTSQDPSTGSPRVVTLTSLKDSGGTANGGKDTVITSIASTVTLKSINDAPTLSATGLDPAFREGGGAVQLFSGTSVDTIETGQKISRLVITLTHVAGDGSLEFLSMDGTEVSLAGGSGTTAAGGFDYTVNLSSGTASVEITKTDTAAAYAALVDSLAYRHTGTGLDNNPRKAEITLVQDTGGTADGGIDTNTALAVSSTVNVHPSPVITVGQYDWQAGTLVLTGTDFVSSPGAGNDIDASGLTITGAKGFQYTLSDTPDGEITGPTLAVLTLGPSDRLEVQSLLNKDGAHAGSGTAYNLSAAEDWMTGSPAPAEIADPATAVTVTNHILPAITDAVYVSDTGVLAVTGSHFVKNPGAGKDIDISALTLTGGVGNQVYTITSTADVDILSPTEFSLTLTGTDKTDVDKLLDQLGTSSSGGSTYNLSAGDNWMTGADAAADISEATNGVRVVINPKITSAAYDAGTGVLKVTGTNIQASGGLDIDASKFTLTGEGGETYTLTDTPNVNRDNVNGFTLNLSAADQAGVNQIINRDGTESTGGTAYNLAAGDDWNTNMTAGDTADTTGNLVTASNLPAPAITSADYDAAAGILVVTGKDFTKLAGDPNDIDVSKLAFIGEGNQACRLTNTPDVEITSPTSFTVTLGPGDKNRVNMLVNKNGMASTGGTVYNLAADEDWAKGADPGVPVADTTGNPIDAANVLVPVITSAAYTKQTGTLKVTGSNLLSFSGANNDIDASSFTLTGKAGGTYTLTDTADVDITSTTEFSLILSSTDKTAIEALIDKSGTQSTDNTAYNLSAGEDWNLGADAAINITDTAGNSINADLTVPTTGSGGGTSPSNDGDGASDVIENQAPPIDDQGTTGDGNGDGISDSDQAQVASTLFLITDQISTTPNAPATYVTLVADSQAGKGNTGDGTGTTLQNVRQLDAPDDTPEDIIMPLGLIRFNADLENKGETETFSIYLNNDIDINGYWKQNTSGQWVNLASREYGGAVVREGNKIRLDFQIADGGEFDDDGQANGVITDPGAPGYRESDVTEIVRFYNPDCFLHMYSASADEIGVLSSEDSGWILEGVAFRSNTGSVRDVHRFYNPTTGDHFFTADEAEAQGLHSSDTSGYVYEGVSFQVDSIGDSANAIGRYYNPVNSEHFYTTSADEAVIITGQMDFVYEGILGYGI